MLGRGLDSHECNDMNFYTDLYTVPKLGTSCSAFSLASFISYALDNPVALYGCPCISLTRPGAAVNIRAMPLSRFQHKTKQYPMHDLLSMMSCTYLLSLQAR